MKAQHTIDAKNEDWVTETRRCTSSFLSNPSVDGRTWELCNRSFYDVARLLLKVADGLIVCELTFSILSDDTLDEDGFAECYSGWNLLLHRRNEDIGKESCYTRFWHADIGWVTGEEAARKAVAIIQELGRKFSSI